MKVDSAIRFGAHLGEKLRAASNLKGSRAAAAAAIHAPINPPAWDHFTTEVRMLQGRQAMDSLAFAMAGHRAAYKQLPPVKNTRDWRRPP